jgi:hypothetical protein
MFIFNETIPLLVQMFPNPKRIEISSAKVFSQTQTLGGWVFEHWGEKPQVIRVHGRTQGIVGNYDNTVAVEAALFQLEQIYRLDKRDTLSIIPKLSLASPLVSVKGLANLQPSDLRTLSKTIIYYRYDFYQGFFTNFKWEQDAEQNPKHYEYEFEFLATGSGQNMLADLLFVPSGEFGAVTTAVAGTALSGPAALNAIKAIAGGVSSIGSAIGSAF